MGRCFPEPVGVREGSPGPWSWKGERTSAKVGTVGNPVAYPHNHSYLILWVPVGLNHLTVPPGPGLNVLGWGWVLLGCQTGGASQREFESKLPPYM